MFMHSENIKIVKHLRDMKTKNGTQTRYLID